MLTLFAGHRVILELEDLCNLVVVLFTQADVWVSRLEHHSCPIRFVDDGLAIVFELGKGLVPASTFDGIEPGDVSGEVSGVPSTQGQEGRPHHHVFLLLCRDRLHHRHFPGPVVIILLWHQLDRVDVLLDVASVHSTCQPSLGVRTRLLLSKSANRADVQLSIGFC